MWYEPQNAAAANKSLHAPIPKQGPGTRLEGMDGMGWLGLA